MKKRHILLGFSIVLVLSLAVPALGAGGLSGVKSLAKKALAVANGAQNAAGNAQQAAGNAQDAAKAAQATANTAQATANTAQTKANGAQTTAEGAQGAAGAARNAANAAQGTADAAKTTADTAATDVAGKFAEIARPPAVIAHSTSAGSIKEGTAICPEGDVVSGGYQFTAGTAEVHVDKAEGNGWRVQAQSDGDPYEFSIFVYCLVR